MTELLSIILAAGEGTRMRSALPKVLHKVGGLPMLWHVIHAAAAAGTSATTVVIGPGQEALAAQIDRADPAIDVVVQAERLGTAHAVRHAGAALLDAHGNVIVLYGDTPLVTPATITALVRTLDEGADLVVVGFVPDDPSGYGRLLTAGNRLLAIREDRDASEDEREVRLCNSGIMGFKAEALRAVIDRIGNANAKGEYYLTDAVELANIDDLNVEYIVADAKEVIGIDDRTKLALAEQYFQERRRREFLSAGVTLSDPQTVYFAWDTQIGRDVTIEPNVVIGPGVRIGENVAVRAFSHLEDVTIGSDSSVGPFTRIRGGATLGDDVHLGNFVEVKKSVVHTGVKAGHLSYLGDAEIGEKTNIGAGTITCNYDGVNKDKTTIGARVFIGSNSSLVAPVTIGDGAYVASGSVITDDVEPDATAFGRARQVNKPGYAPRLRAKAEAIKAAKKAKG
jgi:bifunctional UDP-N-acetylglucosamine pyrophosphorylase/glucosamine-1-phosphate N-acetyltransferase